MKKNIQSMLLSSGVFAVSVSILFLTTLMNIDGELVLALGVAIPLFLFLFFWTYRSILKTRGDWHSAGTVWLVFLMVLFGLWGFCYVFILHGNDSILTVSSTAPLTDTALMSMQLTVLYLIAEIVIAVFSGIFRLLKKHTLPTA